MQFREIEMLTISLRELDTSDRYFEFRKALIEEEIDNIIASQNEQFLLRRRHEEQMKIEQEIESSNYDNYLD